MGAVALQKAIILDLTMILLLFSLGVWIVSKKYLEWLRIPIIYAAAAGLFFSFTKIEIPALIFKPLVILAEITIPLMLVSLGGKLADLQKIKNLKAPLLATLLRTFGGLLIGSIFVYLFQVKGLTREVILLYAALPAPVMAYVLAQKYHQHETLAAEIVFLSNLSAILILPIVIYLIRFIF
jgi:predicted permease